MMIYKAFTILVLLLFCKTNDIYGQDKEFVKEFYLKFQNLNYDQILIDGLSPNFQTKIKIENSIINTFFREKQSTHIEQLFLLDKKNIETYPIFKKKLDTYTIYIIGLKDKKNNSWSYYWLSLENNNWDNINNLPIFYGMEEIATFEINNSTNIKTFIYNDLINNYVFKKDSTFYLFQETLGYKKQQKYSDEDIKKYLTSYNYRFNENNCIIINKDFFNSTENVIPVNLIIDTNQLPYRKVRDELPYITSFDKKTSIKSFFIDRLLLEDSSTLYLYITEYKNTDYSIYKELNYCIIDKNIRWSGYDNLFRIKIDIKNNINFEGGKIEYLDNTLSFFSFQKNKLIKQFKVIE